LLTTTVESIPIQQIACPTAAVEATNGIITHLFTSSIVDGTHVIVCMRWNHQLIVQPPEPSIASMVSCRLVYGLHRRWKNGFGGITCRKSHHSQCAIYIDPVVKRLQRS